MFVPNWIMLLVRRCIHLSFAVVLNTLRRDLFSASLMHHFNGSLILFRAPEGPLRLVMCASVVCSLPISRQISYLQSGSKKRVACKKKRWMLHYSYYSYCFLSLLTAADVSHSFLASTMTNIKNTDVMLRK